MQAAPVINSLILVDQTKGTSVTLQTGATLNPSDIYYVKAVVNGQTACVKFQLDAFSPSIDSSAPFTSNAGKVAIGSHVMRVTPFARTGARGTTGASFTRTFTAKATPVATPTVSPTATPSTTRTIMVWVANPTPGDTYQIFVATKAGQFGAPIAMSGASSVEIPNLLVGQTYLIANVVTRNGAHSVQSTPLVVP